MRVGLKAGGVAYSYIDHDVCRSCGRCVLSCPSGAISLPLYSQHRLQEQLEHSIRKNNGIAVIASYWDLISLKEELPAVELMTSTGVTPALLIQALASGAKGVLLFHKESWAQHYLPVESDVEDMVEDTRDILAVVGVDPDRVVASLFTPGSAHQAVSDFAARLEEKGLEPYTSSTQTFHSTLPQGGLGRELALLKELASQEGRQVSPLLLEGMVLKGAGLPDTLTMLESIELLSERLDLGLGFGEGTDKADRGEDIIVATPEGHQAILEYQASGEDKEHRVSLLPQLIASKISSMEFDRTEAVTVAILNPNPESERGFMEPLQRILEQIPNCELITLEEWDCGQTGWKEPNAESRRKAMSVYRAAQKAGAKLIVTASAACLTHLLATNRPGAWRHSPVEVVDVYSFICSRLKGGEGCE